MIVELIGQLIERKSNAVVINVNDLFYEVLVPVSVLQRINDHVGKDGQLRLIIHHYIQIGPSTGTPVMIGFLNTVERDFFQEFIKVSGIGPRAAVRALNKPISEIAHAIAEGNCSFLKSLPGIGVQKAKEIVAKLQNRVGKYGLIQDVQDPGAKPDADVIKSEVHEEALEVLLQLQYKKQEAKEMIQKVLKRKSDIKSAEELLNEIYKQRIKL